MPYALARAALKLRDGDAGLGRADASRGILVRRGT